MFRGEHAVVRGSLELKTAAPGSKGRLVITADPQPPYHVYALADRDPEAVGTGKPTLIVVDPNRRL